VFYYPCFFRRFLLKACPPSRAQARPPAEHGKADGRGGRVYPPQAWFTRHMSGGLARHQYGRQFWVILLLQQGSGLPKKSSTSRWDGGAFV